MSKKKAAKAKAARGIRNLPAKTLGAKSAQGVRGGFYGFPLEEKPKCSLPKGDPDKFLIVKMNDVL